LVGSPLSINALREELQLGHRTVAKWIGMLERLYAFMPCSGSLPSAQRGSGR
jgi:predicted AAA+ superfamily ATPase